MYNKKSRLFKFCTLYKREFLSFFFFVVHSIACKYEERGCGMGLGQWGFLWTKSESPAPSPWCEFL